MFLLSIVWRLCDEDVSIGSPNKRSSSHTLHLHLQERGTCTTHLKNRFTLCRFLRGPWFLHGFPKGLSWRPTSVCSSTAAETLSLPSTDWKGGTSSQRYPGRGCWDLVFPRLVQPAAKTCCGRESSLLHDATLWFFSARVVTGFAMTGRKIIKWGTSTLWFIFCRSHSLYGSREKNHKVECFEGKNVILFL